MRLKLKLKDVKIVYVHGAACAGFGYGQND